MLPLQRNIVELVIIFIPKQKSVFLILFYEVKYRFRIQRVRLRLKFQKEHKLDRKWGLPIWDLEKRDCSHIEGIWLWNFKFMYPKNLLKNRKNFGKIFKNWVKIKILCCDILLYKKSESGYCLSLDFRFFWLKKILKVYLFKDFW